MLCNAVRAWLCDGILPACKIIGQVGWTYAQWSEGILVHGRTTECTQHSLCKYSMKEQLGFVQFWGDPVGAFCLAQWLKMVH